MLKRIKNKDIRRLLWYFL